MEQLQNSQRTVSYGFAALWKKHGKEAMIQRARKTNKRAQVQEFKRQWLKLGVMNEIAAFSLAFKLTGIEFRLTRAKIELLLYSEVLEEKFNYVSSNRFRELVGFRQSRGVFSLAQDGYLELTGDRARPHKLTPVGHRVCATFKKNFSDLNEDTSYKKNRKRLSFRKELI